MESVYTGFTGSDVGLSEFSAEGLLGIVRLSGGTRQIMVSKILFQFMKYRRTVSNQ